MYLYIVITILIILLNIILIIDREEFSNYHIEPTYIFWTGGYDSTFRLCQLLIDEKKVVKPVYISDIIDNDKSKTTRRKSITQEFDSMEEITKKLKNKYPYIKKNMLPLININNVKIDKDIHKAMYNLYKKKRMRRPICQYSALAQVSRDLNKNVEMSVEYAPKDSMMYRNVHDSLDCTNKRCKIKDTLDKKNKDLHIFKNCTFPTIKLSKKNMLEIAKKNGYEDILKITWSCWYPINGNPCGRCVMCRERII